MGVSAALHNPAQAIYLYIAVSCLFLYIKFTPVVSLDCRMSFCAGFSLCYVRDGVCVMCGL